jgi:hypothetical protein
MRRMMIRLGAATSPATRSAAWPRVAWRGLRRASLLRWSFQAFLLARPLATGRASTPFLAPPPQQGAAKSDLPRSG